MDPNATLERLRELVGETFKAETDEEKAGLADEMAELVEALDGWMLAGGFSPWTK